MTQLCILNNCKVTDKCYLMRKHSSYIEVNIEEKADKWDAYIDTLKAEKDVNYTLVVHPQCGEPWSTLDPTGIKQLEKGFNAWKLNTYM